MMIGYGSGIVCAPTVGAALGLRKIRRLSNTTHKVVGLDGYRVELVEQVRV